MKLLAAFFFVLFPVLGFSQGLPVDSVSHKVTYSGVVQVPGASKEELYSRAREWFATYFNSSKTVLEMDDRSLGKMVGTGYSDIRIPTVMPGLVDHQLWRTMKVEARDGRYRYEWTDIKLAIGGNNSPAGTKYPLERQFDPKMGFYVKADGTPRKGYAGAVTGITEAVKQDLGSLQQAMQKKSTAKDW